MDSEDVIVLVVKDEEKIKLEGFESDDVHNATEQIQMFDSSYKVEVKCEELTLDESENLISEYLDEEFLTESGDDDKNKYKDLLIPTVKRKYARRVNFKESFVARLKTKYKDSEDESPIIDELVQKMRDEKPPLLSKKAFSVDDDGYTCLYCDALFDKLPVVTRHYHETHGPRYLKCYACGVDFRSKTNLYKHEKRCNAPFAHLILKARARSIGSKARHRPYLNLVDQERTKISGRYRCSLCSASFSSKEGIMAHENLHKGLRPFCCHICPNAYTSKRALQRHLIHHSDSQFVCDHCERSFKIKSGLISHLEVHNPVRRFGCPECDRRYKQRGDLEAHILRVHKNMQNPCACPLCPKRYARMSQLNQHTKTIHGVNILTRKALLKSLPASRFSPAEPNSPLECDPSSLLSLNVTDYNTS